MTIQELINILKTIPNKEAEITLGIETQDGFVQSKILDVDIMNFRIEGIESESESKS